MTIAPSSRSGSKEHHISNLRITKLLRFNNPLIEREFRFHRFFFWYNIRSLFMSGIYFVSFVTAFVAMLSNRSSYLYQDMSLSFLIAVFKSIVILLIILIIFCLNFLCLLLWKYVKKSYCIIKLTEYFFFSLWIFYLLLIIHPREGDGTIQSPQLHNICNIYWFIQPRFMLSFSWSILIFLYFTLSFLLYLIGIEWKKQGDEYRGLINFTLYEILVVFYILIGLLFNFVLEYNKRKVFLNEKLIEEEDKKLIIANAKTGSYLRNILPRKFLFLILDHIQNKSRMKNSKDLMLNKHLENVIFFFSDFVNFTKFCDGKGPSEIIDVVNGLFNQYDSCSLQFGVNRLTTIGDAYLACSWNENDCDDEYNNMIRFAQAILGITKEMKQFDLRIGIASGNIHAVLFGRTMLSFDVIGEVRVVVECLETNAPINRIMVNDKVHFRTSSTFNYDEKLKKIYNSVLKKHLRGYILQNEISSKNLCYKTSIRKSQIGAVTLHGSWSLLNKDNITTPIKKVEKRNENVELFSSPKFALRFSSIGMYNSDFSLINSDSTCYSTFSSITSIRQSWSFLHVVSRYLKFTRTCFINRNYLSENEWKEFEKHKDEEGVVKYIILGIVASLFIGIYLLASMQKYNRTIFPRGVFRITHLVTFIPLIFFSIFVSFITFLYCISFVKMFKKYIFYVTFTIVCVCGIIFNFSFFPIANLFRDDIQSWFYLFIFCDNYTIITTKVIFLIFYYIIYVATRWISGILYFGKFNVYNISDIDPHIGLSDFFSLLTKIVLLMLDYKSSFDSFMKRRRLLEQMSALKRRKKANVSLLLSILPRKIYNKIKIKFDCCSEKIDGSVCFVKVLGVYERILNGENDALKDLNEIFCRFTKITMKMKCTRIKCLQDNFICVSGLESKDEDGHRMMTLCQRFLDDVKNMNLESRIREEKLMDLECNYDEKNEDLNNELGIKIGISRGPFLSGLIGDRQFHFDILGDVVNRAARFSSISKRGMINVCENFQSRLPNDFMCWKEKLKVDVKGLGIVNTYLFY